MSTARIQQYFACLNERRIEDAAALFAEDARFSWVPFGALHDGRAGIRDFMKRWGTAFPDADFTIVHIEDVAPRTYEVEVAASGTHTGVLETDMRQFAPTHRLVLTSIHQRFEFDTLDRIVYTSVLMERLQQDLMPPGRPLDLSRLNQHVDEIVRLRADLDSAGDDPAVTAAVAQRLTHELEEALQLLLRWSRR